MQCMSESARDQLDTMGLVSK